jgi:hypothetical protein
MDPVDDQFAAYNERDIDRFASSYDPDVVIEDGEGNLLMKGLDSLRASYGALFNDSPKLRCRLVKRIRVGEYVVDEEDVTGFNVEGSPERLHAVAIYRVQRDKIVHVRLLK